MDFLMILVAVLVLVMVALGWLIVRKRRRHSARRDDLLRVGDEAEASQVAASRRAEGKSAWTRISGGGM